MRTTHLIILTMAAVSLMGCNPKETVNALTSDQNVTQKMAVRFAENMVGLPRALVVSCRGGIYGHNRLSHGGHVRAPGH